MKIKYILLIFCSMFLFSSCIDEQVIVDNTPKPQGSLIISSVPAGAKIFFLGTDIKKTTPDSIMSLESGTFEVALKLDGYRDTTFLVTVLNNHKATRNIILNELEVGSIYVESDPIGAQIFFAGKSTNKVTPDSLINIEPGVYSLLLRLPGFRDTSVSVSVTKKVKSEMNVLLKDTLPELKIDIGYTKIQFGQMLFTFKFNRDIILDEIISYRPNSTDSVITDFMNDNVEEGEQRIIIFNSSDKGIWHFRIKGAKAEGDKRIFERYQSVEVN